MTENRFVVAQLPEIPPRTSAEPLHRHRNEDEGTYVVSGPLGTLAGDEVITAEPGTWPINPRGKWHTFWNGGDVPCHMIEIVSPAGFERCFDELGDAGDDLEEAPGDQREVRDRQEDGERFGTLRALRAEVP